MGSTIKATFLPSSGQKWQNTDLFKNFTLFSQSQSHNIDNNIISVFLELNNV